MRIPCLSKCWPLLWICTQDLSCHSDFASGISCTHLTGTWSGCHPCHFMVIKWAQGNKQKFSGKPVFRRYLLLLSPLGPKACLCTLFLWDGGTFLLLPKEAGSVVLISQMREPHIREIVCPGQVLMPGEGEDRGFEPHSASPIGSSRSVNWGQSLESPHFAPLPHCQAHQPISRVMSHLVLIHLYLINQSVL